MSEQSRMTATRAYNIAASRGMGASGTGAEREGWADGSISSSQTSPHSLMAGGTAGPSTLSR
eukprot:1925750-Pyramimonas_sp.AAC.1